ncbi:2,5-diketo-D-gluconic acid reductase [Saccharopolyspora erythraea NRRL 2338]|uniref:2,5-diketo-D-gluconic acid reductase n=2 Tax=Saccharopolyspora erythraea TaxID=1836 RepID=A4FEB9_SACEN|nr:2,5-diketo-D-gluconic acid reductase [Saccharopolyspora erythraea NRRL 2338]
MTSVPTVTLNNGVEMPQLGYGVFQVPEDETAAAVGAALEAGYRSIDTAAAYGNEAAVGRALAGSGLARDELFVTTKLWNADQGYDNALRAFDTSLELLGLDHLDLYLIHWPTLSAVSTGRPGAPWRSCTRRAGSARSASPTSSPRTCATSPSTAAWCPR